MFFSGLEKTGVLGIGALVQEQLKEVILTFFSGLVPTGVLGTSTRAQKQHVEEILTF